MTRMVAARGLMPSPWPSEDRPWVIYIRVSKTDQLLGFSPEGMEKRCRAKLAELGHRLLESAGRGGVFLESGKGNDWNLPKLWEVVKLAQAGAIGGVMCFDTGRLARDMGKRVWIKTELKRARVPIKYANVDFDDSPEGELQENIFGSFDQYERAKIGMRTSLGIHTKLEAQLVIGNGRTPYGLERVRDERGRTISFRPTPEGAALLRSIREQLLTDTLAETCRRLNLEQVPTPDKAPKWTSGTILSLLGNAVYCGEYQWGRTTQTVGPDGKLVKKAADPENVTTILVEPVWTRMELLETYAALERRKRTRKGRRPADPFILRGRLTCGHCGGALSCTTNNGYRRYTCLRTYPKTAELQNREQCTLPQVMASDLESHAWRLLVDELLDPDRLRRGLERAMDGDEALKRHQSQADALKAQIDRLAKRVRQATEDIYKAEEDSETAAYAREVRFQAERDLKDLRTQLADLERRTPARLTRSQVDAVLSYADRVRTGLEKAAKDASAQQWLFKRLDITGKVCLGVNGDGVKCGRKHQFRIEWDGILKLSDSAKHPQGSLM